MPVLALMANVLSSLRSVGCQDWGEKRGRGTYGAEGFAHLRANPSKREDVARESGMHVAIPRMETVMALLR